MLNSIPITKQKNVSVILQSLRRQAFKILLAHKPYNYNKPILHQHTMMWVVPAYLAIPIKVFSFIIFSKTLAICLLPECFSNKSTSLIFAESTIHPFKLFQLLHFLSTYPYLILWLPFENK